MDRTLCAVITLFSSSMLQWLMSKYAINELVLFSLAAGLMMLESEAPSMFSNATLSQKFNLLVKLQPAGIFHRKLLSLVKEFLTKNTFLAVSQNFCSDYSVEHLVQTIFSA